MRKQIIIIILILFEIGCTNKGNTRIEPLPETNNGFEKLTENQESKYSTIKKSEITINGLPIEGYTLDSLKKYLGDPDSAKECDRIGMGEGLHTKYYYDKSGVKLMARAAFDPKPLFGIEEHEQFKDADLKLYTEAAILGVKNYPLTYEEPRKGYLGEDIIDLLM